MYIIRVLLTLPQSSVWFVGLNRFATGERFVATY